MAQQIAKSLKGLKDYAGTAANAGIVLATGGIEQIATIALYRCPCVEPPLLAPGCNKTMSSLSCTRLLNVNYGFSFIFAPAFALFAFSIAASPKLWKIITGCCKKTERLQEDCQTVSWTLASISIRGLVSPGAWVCIALLDGRYLACALTPLPYLIGINGRYATCEDVSSNQIFIISITPKCAMNGGVFPRSNAPGQQFQPRKKRRCGDEPFATLCPIWTAR